MNKKVTITGFRTRKEVAEILDISIRSLHNVLNSEYFKDKIPKRERLSPVHQRIIFDYFGILYD